MAAVTTASAAVGAAGARRHSACYFLVFVSQKQGGSRLSVSLDLRRGNMKKKSCTSIDPFRTGLPLTKGEDLACTQGPFVNRHQFQPCSSEKLCRFTGGPHPRLVQYGPKRVSGLHFSPIFHSYIIVIEHFWDRSGPTGVDCLFRESALVSLEND